MQRQGYPSLDQAWGAVVRAHFVPFGDGVVIDPARRVAVTHHRGSRRSLCEPITQSLGWAVIDSKTSGALVVRGVRRSQVSGNHGVGQSRCRAITVSGNHGVGQSRCRTFAVSDSRGVGQSRRRTVSASDSLGVGQSRRRTNAASWVHKKASLQVVVSSVQTASASTTMKHNRSCGHEST